MDRIVVFVELLPTVAICKMTQIHCHSKQLTTVLAYPHLTVAL